MEIDLSPYKKDVLVMLLEKEIKDKNNTKRHTNELKAILLDVQSAQERSEFGEGALGKSASGPSTLKILATKSAEQQNLKHILELFHITTMWKEGSHAQTNFLLNFIDFAIEKYPASPDDWKDFHAWSEKLFGGESFTDNEKRIINRVYNPPSKKK